MRIYNRNNYKTITRINNVPKKYRLIKYQGGAYKAVDIKSGLEIFIPPHELDKYDIINKHKFFN